jgi:aldehyde dehydrogenase (NAD(P)+)
MIVPGPYTDDELSSMADNVAGMITNNGSFNCNAAKLLITPKGWDRRDQFLQKVGAVLAGVKTRKAYYPGAFQRYESLTTGHSDVRKIGTGTDRNLPWTLVVARCADDSEGEELLHAAPCHPARPTGSTDPLSRRRPRRNDRGARRMRCLRSSAIEADPDDEGRAQGAIRDPKARHRRRERGRPSPTPQHALGGHPSATLSDIQSGLGWARCTVISRTSRGASSTPR